MITSWGPGVARRAVAVVATVLAVALGLVAAAAPSSGAPATAGSASFPPERPTRVLAVGDSVMEGAASAIPAALPGRDVVVDTEVSRSTGASADSAAGHGTDWDVVVVLLGHNDGGSPSAYQPAYRVLLDQFAGVPRIVELTIHEVRPYYAGVNEFLRAEASARANVRVADWNAAVSQSPNATAGDGLHLTGSGAGLMAGLIADQVITAEADATPPPTTTTTTTTLPPTTTTTAPPTTLPPTTTTTTPPTTTTTTRPVDIEARSLTVGEPAEDGAAPPVIWLVLVVASGAAYLVLRRLGRHFPT